MNALMKYPKWMTFNRSISRLLMVSLSPISSSCVFGEAYDFPDHAVSTFLNHAVLTFFRHVVRDSFLLRRKLVHSLTS